MSSTQTQKIKFRADLKELRAQITGPLRLQFDQAIRENLFSLEPFQQAGAVFCFISCGTEVDTHQIIDQLPGQEKQLAVPKIMDSGQMEAIRFEGWRNLEPDRMGILTPKSSENIMTDFDITITPGLGFSLSGNRLGYGRGYYDSWFSRNNGGTKIALAYERQVYAEIPASSHDIKVDMILTEERIISL